MARDAHVVNRDKFSGSQSSVTDFKRDCEWGTDWKKKSAGSRNKGLDWNQTEERGRGWER